MEIILICAGILMLCVFFVSLSQNHFDMMWWVVIPLIASLFLIGAGICSFL